MSDRELLAEQLENIKGIAEHFEPITENGHFTCLPMLFAIKMGADKFEMSSAKLGCDNDCWNCILSVDNTEKLDTILNELRLENLLDG